MPYATQQDMIDRFGMPKLVQLTDINEPFTGALVPEVLERALEDAQAEIDGYLAGRMSVPLVVVPPVIKRYSIVIAHKILLGAAVDEATTDDYKAAIAYLRDVARGQISLTTPDAAPPAPGLGAVLFSPGQKAFGREGDL